MATDVAVELAALVDTLLPGGAGFPSAVSVGAHGLVAGRLRQRLGVDGLARLAETLVSCGGPIGDKSTAERQAIVARFAEEHAGLFGDVRMAAYLSYYENPAVVDAVRGLGRAYNDAPQPAGYVLPAFDGADALQAPTHGRGHYVATKDVQRVELGALPDDPTAPESA